MRLSAYNNFKKIAIFLISAAVVIGVIFFLDKNPPLFAPSLEKIENTLNNSDTIDKIKQEISSPGPLVNKEDAPQSYLTQNGVLIWTNIARKENGSLPPLTENSQLDRIAEERLNDLFAKQYFEHISPEGIGASDIAEKIGYQFLSIGENLALGNFKDDKAIVDAWMNSPGHRANILNAHYQEIGIAVKKDIYKGQKTWIGVQIFARPLSACPQPEKNLKSQIDIAESRRNQMEGSLEALKAELANMSPQNKQELVIYNQKVEEYNSQVKKFNALTKELKSMISEYNNQVDVLNKCVSR